MAITRAQDIPREPGPQPSTLPDEPLGPEGKVAFCVEALESAFGVPKPRARGNPLGSLILTLLSQSTNDRNRDQAYQTLKERFPTWERVMEASTKAVADAIRVGGLANQKSERLQAILRWVKGRFGELSLDAVHEMSNEDVFALLESQKGVGRKTACCVLMFACGRDVFPVDTHVHRIARRLGLVPEKASADKTYDIIQPLIGAGKSYSFHINLLTLGRSICNARAPQCSGCPLEPVCEYAANPSS